MKLSFPSFPLQLWHLCLLMIGFLGSCDNKGVDGIRTGIWRGTLLVQGQQLPFNFEVTSPETKTYQIHLINGDERITTEDVRIRGDSLFATMNTFDTEIEVRLIKRGMTGIWSKRYADGYVVPFQASFGNPNRFIPGAQPSVDISGKWQVKFSKDTVPAIGIFDQQGSRVLGTFLTASGDYRFLEGSVFGDSLFLSAFDGEHAFLFRAKVRQGESMEGEFISGIHWMESWSAVPDASAELISQDSITYLMPGYDKISFSFPDLNGKTVSLNDQKFQQKVVVLQLFGSWCPNCLDETKFLSNWYNSNRQQPVEIIGLAYERLDDFSYAKGRLNIMALKYHVNYQLLVAGTSDKDLASKTLPMLNKISSFPTTIFIDHKGAVRRIHTGFLGPGTGQYYQHFARDFESFINGLIAEKMADTSAVEM